MKFKEDFLIIIRGIMKRPVESLLLILGIALGIGATASGITIVAQSVAESNKMLRETRYREIVVRTRETSSEMDTPAALVNTDNQVFLTANDLAAKKDVPAVEYAYVANRRGLNFRDFRSRPDFRQTNTDGSETRVSIGTSGGGMGEVLIQTEGSTSREKSGQLEVQDEIQAVAGDDVRVALPDDKQQVTTRAGKTGDTPQPEVVIIDSPVPGPGEPLPGADSTVPEGPQPAVDEITAYEVSPEYFQAYNLAAVQGSLFTDEDIKKREPLLILGSEIAKTLFADGISLGRQVQDHNQLLKIVGILEPTGTDLDKAGFTPTVIPDPNSTDPRLRFRGWNTNLRFAVEDPSKLEEARAQLTSWFGQAYGKENVVLTVPREEAEELAARNSRLVTIILILAISGLLIASVNVSNILYCRALRKRKSIGILKAMGATSSHIFALFFAEALIIGVFGALGGSGVAVLLSGLIKSSLGIGGYSIGILGIGVLLSLCTTLFLTNIPAMQTSKIPASDAIRYE